MANRIEIYGDSISGNCYKLQLACAQLEVDYRWHEIDILAGETRTDKFLAMNPNGKVPLLKLPDGRCLAESNAILFYLANGNLLAGRDRFETASILSWMFFEQYSHEPYIATSRFIIQYLGNPADRQDELEAKRVGGYKALNVMEGALSNNDFISNNAYSIADIALYAYTHVAEEGGFDLAGYSNINAWMMRVQSQRNHVAMKT
jgi:glutathione S-transferase